MDFIEVLQTISSKIGKQKHLIKTEEATKNAFVMPFISALGYDVFDPAEVVPEFVADVGLKKAKKLIMPSNMMEKLSCCLNANAAIAR